MIKNYIESIMEVLMQYQIESTVYNGTTYYEITKKVTNNDSTHL